ncbi:EcsC family protein [Halobacillus litoralis]|uniref:EcsC family protein n=1 Tax=Halobacillus litoralis TaxID=45668 RepID=A0A845DLS8_9BACI|nr:EcsC family protein [Halobacillus litoralis]MYL18386.1 EcsC family protein [Halobacillus litoralis]
MNYEQKVKKEAVRWSRSLDKRSALLQRTSKPFQQRINNRIPGRIHKLMTESVRSMIEAALTTSEYLRPVAVEDWTWEERERKVKELLKQYKRTASLEGAGTGAGGIWLGLADFPLLLSIQMKFLFYAAQVCGMNIHSYENRVYLMHVFMLAYSSDEVRKQTKEKVMNWKDVPIEEKIVDWKTLQMEYRDTLDIVKLLQIVPGIGAVVGFVANGRLLEQLGETALQSFRLRFL